MLLTAFSFILVLVTLPFSLCVSVKVSDRESGQLMTCIHSCPTYSIYYNCMPAAVLRAAPHTQSDLRCSYLLLLLYSSIYLPPLSHLSLAWMKAWPIFFPHIPFLGFLLPICRFILSPLTPFFCWVSFFRANNLLNERIPFILSLTYCVGVGEENQSHPDWIVRNVCIYLKITRNNKAGMQSILFWLCLSPLCFPGCSRVRASCRFSSRASPFGRCQGPGSVLHHALRGHIQKGGSQDRVIWRSATGSKICESNNISQVTHVAQTNSIISRFSPVIQWPLAWMLWFTTAFQIPPWPQTTSKTTGN